VADLTNRPWGIGFLSWSAAPEVVALALARQPHAVMLSFGDPAALARLVVDAGVRLVVQVTDLDEARQAIDLGADVIVAQGAEAGGHSGRRSTFPFVPVVADLAAPMPVLAAGGIADGRGLAAALALGAAGALVGTRFEVAPEALVQPGVAEAILAAGGDQTERSRELDIARGAPWPAAYPARTLRNAFLDRWRGRAGELAGDEAAQEEYRRAAGSGDLSVLPVWASEAIDLIDDVVPAAELVGRLAAGAEEVLTRLGGVV
jgi:nitronate monooxygenase